jgi:hypothetical protein
VRVLYSLPPFSFQLTLWRATSGYKQCRSV